MSSRLSLRSDLTSESFAACTLLGAALLAGTAHGQTNAPVVAPATGTTNQLPTVVVTDTAPNPYVPETVSSPKYTAPLRDTPQAITVVPKQLMDEQGATSLADVLRNVPGISLAAGEGGVPAGDIPSIRGSSARTDIFLDGIRDFGGYTRDTFNLESVTVIKGPASAVAGRGATGGTVLMTSKTPEASPFYQGTIGFGTDEYKRATLDINQPLSNASGKGLESAAVRLNGLWYDGEVADRDFVSNKRWGAAPSFTYGLGTATRITASYFYLGQDNLPSYGLPWVPANTNAVLSGYSNSAPPVDDSNFYGIAGRDYEETESNVGTVRLEHDFSDTFSLRSAVRYGQTTRDSVITAPRFVNANTNTAINRQIQSRDQTDSIWATQHDLRKIFETGSIEHDVVAGFEYNYEQSKNYLRTGPTSTTDLFNPTPNDPVPGPVRRTGAVNDATADSFAIYALDTIKLTDQWQLKGGVRWDYFDAKMDAHATNGTVTSAGRIDREPSFLGAVVFKPRENGSIYFAYGTSFNPSIEGLTASASPTAVNSVNLDPEENRSYELGTKWNLFRDRVNLSAALFRNEKFNARTEDPTDSSDIQVNEGEQYCQGIDLGIGGQLTRDWTLSFGYAFQESEITESRNPRAIGNELANTPEHSVKIWTTYRLPGGITIGGGPEFKDSIYTSIDSASRRQTSSYWLWDAMVSYEVNKNVTLRLNVYNLANEDYIAAAGGGHFIPGSGRSATLTASFKF